MDVQLARTFLAVVQEGSFVAAADKLFVTQSAVSLRIRKLEDLLGRTVFERSKAGVTLTPAGRQLERFATASLRMWEEARHMVAVPEQYERTLMIGAVPSLLPRLAMRLLSRLEQRLPRTAFRIETGSSERLMRMLMEGTLDVVLTYAPELRSGIEVEELFADELVLVAAEPSFTARLDDRYVYMDWGPGFRTHHAASFPGNATPRSSFSIGTLALDFVIRERRAGYFPARVVREHVRESRLHLVPDAPTFLYPCYVALRSGIDDDLRLVTLKELRRLARLWDTLQEEMLDTLEDISTPAPIDDKNS